MACPATVRCDHRKPIFVEVEIGVRWADVMKHPDDGASNPIGKSFGAVHMDHAPDKILAIMTDRIMGGEIVADRREDAPFVAHQVRAEI